MLYVEIAVVIVLVCVNGLLSMSELAIVSSRPGRLKAMIGRNVRGAAKALELGSNPGKFLSSVQIGITLVGIVSGAFSGATLGERLADTLRSSGVAQRAADPLGVGIVVALITYFSLVAGELVPKQIALRNPEGVAVRAAPFMAVLAIIAAPLVFLLDISGRTLLRLLGQRGKGEEKVTDDEIKMIVAEAEHHGTIESDERRMIAGVMRLGDRAVRAIMTPRTDIDWINLQADEASLRKLLMETQHSRLPAGDSVDAMIGVVQTRDVLSALLSGRAPDPRKHVRTAPIVYDQADALDVLARLKESDMPMALVHDEYGNFEGVVTPADILEAITGVFRSDLDAGDENESAVQRDDGSWLLAGYMPADEMADTLGIDLPENRDYETVAGYVLSYLGHLPATGETVDAQGWRFEVVDLDGRRIDKIIAARLPAGHRSVAR